MSLVWGLYSGILDGKEGGIGEASCSILTSKSSRFSFVEGVVGVYARSGSCSDSRSRSVV